MKSASNAVVASIILLSLAAPVAAGPFEDAAAAYGRGDYATSLRLIRPLADQGDANAQFNLGVRYDNGEGVPRNYVNAYMWFNLAAAQGYQDAEKNRDLVKQRMTPAQIIEAQELARVWKSNSTPR